ncbi:MAG TPA: hypothetical protein VGR45_05035 [Stellaceae bacterium]|nr:hypothetical protein [Stellaceae bacterium]
MDAIEIRLPAGIPSRQGWRRDAALRPLSGRDEMFLAEEGAALAPAARASALLTRCLDRLGPCTAVTLDNVRALTVGDRDALLLHLRRLTFGDRMILELVCPNPDCSERMDLDLRVSELLVPPYAEPAETHETTLGSPDAQYRVRFRLPTAGDQELAAAHIADEAAAGMSILRRCVLAVSEVASGAEIGELPANITADLSARMAALDPQAELILNLICPDCGGSLRSELDIADFLFTELADRRRELYRQVHRLAFHYHWSEDAILGMGQSRRLLYLDALHDGLNARRLDA